MIDDAFAQRFGADWIACWNAHDLDRILAHYTDEFELSSPAIMEFGGDKTGKLRRKPAIASYWAKALRLNPALRFELIDALRGIDSITLYYRGVRGPSAEVFFFNSDGKVFRSHAHYS